MVPKQENIKIDQNEYFTLFESIDNSSIDRIFVNSVHLSWESLLEMIDFLCEISKEELKDVKKPKIFCLQKLIEVADFNMDRIKIIWSKVWNKIKDYFSTVGAHPNSKISMFVIDSLKQLSIKFLQVITIRTKHLFLLNNNLNKERRNGKLPFSKRNASTF